MAKRISLVNINTRIRENAEDLAAAFNNYMLKIFAPDAKSAPQLHFDGKVPEAETSSGGRRQYDAATLLGSRRILEA